MKTELFAFVGVMALGVACAHAQEAPPAVPPSIPPVAAPQQAAPPPQSTPPAQPPAGAPIDPAVARPDAPPGAAQDPVNPQRRREQIVLMEGMLERAVRLGAEETARQIRAVQPGLPLFTGIAKARGFYLDSYGLFFHVEIPGVQPSVAWIVEQLERERRSLPAPPGPSRAGVTTGVAFDPNATYTVAVQQRLIDAMLDLRIDLQPDEWLTIAAHDGEGPRSQTQIYESVTLILRVKGVDLSDLRAGRLTPEEARKRVQVSEF